jgi:hypothetical protein
MRATSSMFRPAMVQDAPDFRQSGPPVRSIEPDGPMVPSTETATSGGAAAFTAVPEAPRGRGRRLPETVERLALRDQLVRQWAQRFLPGLSALAAAEVIHRELSRYRAAGWSYERTAEDVPIRHLGRPRELAWRILRTHDALPSIRTLRRALAADRTTDQLAAIHGQRDTRQS